MVSVSHADSTVVEPTTATSLLEKALSENFAHARHVETQRERYISLYWLLWAGLVAYIGKAGGQPQVGFFDAAAEHPEIFGFLSLISLATLILNLKWNAEFANH